MEQHGRGEGVCDSSLSTTFTLKPADTLPIFSLLAFLYTHPAFTAWVSVSASLGSTTGPRAEATRPQDQGKAVPYQKHWHR